MSSDGHGAEGPGWDTITNVGDTASRRSGQDSEGTADPARRGGDAAGDRAPRRTARRVRAASRPAAPAPASGTASGTDGSVTARRGTRRTEPKPAAADRAPERPNPTAATAVSTISAAVPVSPPARTPAPASELPDDRYLNRELSWLDFNARVLALAEDPSQPLLERAKFLAIFASNLDEFYMVRVAGLKRRDETGLAVRSADGLTPREQLARIADAHPGHRRRPRPGSSSTTCGPSWRPPASASCAGTNWPTTSGRGCRTTSRPRSSRCSRRWPWTRRTRSPTSPGCR